MNLQQANKLLDRVKDGQVISPRAVDIALVMTGDLDEDRRGMADGVRSPGLDTALPNQSAGRRQTGSPCMVGENV